MAYGYQQNILGIIRDDAKFLPLNDIIGEYQKPTYIYDLAEIKKRVKLLKQSFNNKVTIHYAMKANNNLAILKLMKSLDVGVDSVSGGEVARAIEVGYDPSHIVLSGVAKTKAEIKSVIQLNISQINIESPAELDRVGVIAKQLNKKINVAFRFNPDVDPDTHPYIKTGFRDNKFGMDHSFIAELEELLIKHKDFVELVGLTIHIGSQLTNLADFKQAILKTRPVWDHFNNKGYKLNTLDIGGGVGINYENEEDAIDYKLIQQYGEMVLQATKDFDCELLLEPGRILVAKAGVLVTEVQYIKQSLYKNFIIVDTGMHHLLRPSLYKAYHRIVPMNIFPDRSKQVFDIVGPICESSDVLGYDRNLQKSEEGELLVICDTGAYGQTMASHYNCHELPLEIAVK